MALSVRERIDAARLSRPGGRLPPVDEVHGRYRLRFATRNADVESVCRLRFQVFNLELNEGSAESYQSGLDRDAFDDQCHHMLVEDAEHEGLVLGTYRLQVAEMAERGRGWYSATEFDLSRAPRATLAVSMELGRACVDREHRNRAVLYLLWRGLAAYALWNGRRYYFGCSSLTSQDEPLGLSLFEELRRDGKVGGDLPAEPLPEFRCAPPAAGVLPPPPKVPTLFSTYLRHGARVCGPPAIDRAFGTIDFLTVLDLADMPERTFRSFAEGLPE